LRREIAQLQANARKGEEEKAALSKQIHDAGATAAAAERRAREEQAKLTAQAEGLKKQIQQLTRDLAEKGKSYAITHIVDRLGAGDAFTAGLIFALTTPGLAAPRNALAFATAAGCLAHSIEGDVNFSTRAEISALASGESAGRVKR
jgi:sugar/nucleoside kinase (ribokinase family)